MVSGYDKQHSSRPNVNQILAYLGGEPRSFRPILASLPSKSEWFLKFKAGSQ